ncbi:hypothetical protein ACHQM5_029878 [Ranunculus cassubicifolius]
MVEDMTDKELEDQLREAGLKLLQLPSSTEEVLAILDKVECCLLRVEQSPSKEMQNALNPSMNALVATDLLGHADSDVNVSVASCVSEITRITAPEAPYTDDQMKQIFQLIVSSFEMLGDTSSRSYQRRVSILETVAKVRSCVVMLDLECDGMILEMFQHFLKSIHDDHPANVFSSMETIMSLVLEESEEIPPELLYPLLNSVKKENQGVLPIARKLGEKVLENCSSKLKPYLMQAVKSLGTSSKDYSKIVSSICQEAPDTTEHDADSVSGEHLADERSLTEEVASDKLPQVCFMMYSFRFQRESLLIPPFYWINKSQALSSLLNINQISEEVKPEAASPVEVDMVSEKSATIATSNGDAPNLKDDTSGAIDSSDKKEDTSEPDSEAPKDESDILDSKTAKSETDPDQPAKKKRGRPSKYSAFTPEASDQSKNVTDGVTKDLASQKKSSSKKDDISSSGEQSVMPSGTEEEVTPKVPSPTASGDEPVKVASPSPTQTPQPDGGHSKRGRPRKKKMTRNDDTDHYSAPVPKEPVSSKKPESDSPLSAEAPEKEESDKEVEGKRTRRPSHKLQLNKEKEKASAAANSDSEDKPLKKSVKKADTKSTKDEATSGKTQESSSKKQGDRTKKGKSKSTPDKKDLPGESSNKKTASSVKSSEKSAGKNKKPTEETPVTKSKRKRTEKEETSEEKSSEEKKPGEEIGENLVGVKIRVYWPMDKAFYNGKVVSFDPSTKKGFEVLYDDGEKEELDLNEEVWERAPEKGKETATKEETTKSGKKTKDTPKAEGTSKGGATSNSKTKGKAETPKSTTSSKAKAESSSKSPKSSTKSKDATTPKSDEETVKTKTKSKGTSQGSKSGANGASKSPETAKSPEKSSKKRKKINS